MFQITEPDQFRFWQSVLQNAKAELGACVARAVECKTCKRWSYEAPLKLISVTPEFYLVRCSGCGTYREWEARVAEIIGFPKEPTAD